MNFDKIFIFQDNITIIGNGSALYANRNDILTIYITGTATSRTIVFEGSDSEGNWYNALACKLPELTMATQTTGTTNEVWTIDMTNWVAVRTRVSSISGGTLRITGKVVNSNG